MTGFRSLFLVEIALPLSRVGCLSLLIKNRISCRNKEEFYFFYPSYPLRLDCTLLGVVDHGIQFGKQLELVMEKHGREMQMILGWLPLEIENTATHSTDMGLE